MTCARETENKYVEHLEKIDRLLKKYAQDYHFYLRDLRSGQEYELGTKKPYPICSCFKLAVLMAFFDSLEDESQLHEEVIIKPEEFSPGGGVLNYLTTPVKFTYFQLCQLMMAFSDGTATDLLIARVGLRNISTTLSKHTSDSNLTQNLKSMIHDFQSHFSIANLKRGAHPNDVNFKDLTNAIDLADLALATFSYSERAPFKKAFLDILYTKKSLPRTSLFFSDEFKVCGKGGSLGHAYFANDCGVIVFNGVPLGRFGITAQGFLDDKDVVEIIFGEIGLEILQALGNQSLANARRCEATRRMIAG